MPTHTHRWSRAGTSKPARLLALAAVFAVLTAAAAGVSAPAARAALTGHIYWGNSLPGSIGEANVDGTGVDQSFITGANGPSGVAIDDQHVYWTNFGSGTIGRANLDGTGVNQSFITGTHVAEGVAVDGQHVYWANFGSGTIGRANLDGTGVDQAFIAGASSPSGVAVDGQHIYWTNFGSGTIGRANLDGTGADQGFMTGASGPLGVAVDDQHIYWTNFNSRTIGRANLDGTEVNESLIDDTGLLNGVAVDGQHIYWSNYTTGAIERANLDGSGVDRSFIAGASGLSGVAVSPAADSTAPSTTVALDPAAPNGDNGWYVSAVHVTVSAADEQGGSGVSETRCVLDPPSVPASFADLPAGCAYTGAGADVSGDGEHVLYAASKDNAGNTETPISRAFRIDATKPTVTCATAPSFLLDQTDATVTASVSDDTSGAAQDQVSAPADTSSVGAKTATVTGADNAGNQAGTACAYSVDYRFDGFAAPVDNVDANGNPVLNVVKAGQVVPLKWRLTDATGAPVTNLAGAQITVVGITCTAGAASDQVEETAAGASGLQNLGDGDYQLNWKSPSSYAGSCKRLRLDLGEGSYHTADFSFTK